MSQFVCEGCGAQFEVPQAALDKYPGWTPKICLKCRKDNGGTTRGQATASSKRGSQRRSKASSQTREEDLPVAEVLARYTAGPDDGVFTDGAANPNPGPGGWGAVLVRKGALVNEAFGAEDHTTNNRMELTALVEGVKLVPEGQPATIYTDSLLCVNTVTKWAKGWEKNGWKRKTGAIKNLELVKELYFLLQQRPELELQWIKAHSGYRWNEYADALATAYRRDTK